MTWQIKEWNSDMSLQMKSYNCSWRLYYCLVYAHAITEIIWVWNLHLYYCMIHAHIIADKIMILQDSHIYIYIYYCMICAHVIADRVMDSNFSSTSPYDLCTWHCRYNYDTPTSFILLYNLCTCIADRVKQLQLSFILLHDWCTCQYR